MAGEPVTLAQVKEHLKLEASDTEQDAYLGLLIPAARRAIENYTGRAIVGEEPTLSDDDRTVVGQAMLLLVGQWFVSREATDTVPPAIGFLVAPLRIWRV